MRKKLFGLLAGVVLALVASAAFAALEVSVQFRTQSDGYRHEGRFDDDVNYSGDWIRNHPQDGYGYFERGRARMSLYDYDNALQDLLYASRYRADDGAVWIM